MTGESPFVKPFTCPGCGAPQTIRALGRSSEFSCGSCGALIDITLEPYQLLHVATTMSHTPQIPLGARGILRGRKYECIGYMVRSDQSGEYPWEEYLLFNPYYGFRWLMTMNGHWNFISPIHADESFFDGNRASFNGEDYKLFLRDEAVVRFVLGEFYWQVKVGDTVSVREYIAPPNTISVETEGYERNYGFAQYIERKEVEKTFALPPLALPSPTGVFPNQPSPYRKNTFFLVTGFLCFLLSLVASAAYFSQRPEQVTALSGVVNPGMASGPIITETFEFTDDGNVGFHLNGEVSNSWVDVDISIINAVNQSALDTAVGVSFYFGREDGEGWSEGSKTATTTIGDIPRGKYYFTIQATGGGNTDGRPIRYDLSIIRHDRYFGNFLLALILGILPVIWNVFGSWGFETKRWATSTQVAQSS